MDAASLAWRLWVPRVLGSLVLLAGTEWPFYLAGLCGVICAFGFYGLRRRADRRNIVAGCAEAG